MASCCCFGQSKYSNRMAVIFWLYILGMIGILGYQLFIGGFILIVNFAHAESPYRGGDYASDVEFFAGLFAFLAAFPLAFLLAPSVMLNRLLSSELAQGASVQLRGMDEKESGMLRYGSVQQWLHVGYTLGWYLYLLLSAVGDIGEVNLPTSYYVLLLFFCAALAALLIAEFVFFWMSWASFSRYLEAEPAPSAPLATSLGYERLDA